MTTSNTEDSTINNQHTVSQTSAIADVDETIVSDPTPLVSAEPVGAVPSEQPIVPSTSSSDGTPVGPDPLQLGAPARQWINQNITPALLDAMRSVVKERPSDPVRSLGKYLIDYADKHPK